MKKLLPVFVLALCATDAFAGESASRGYLTVVGSGSRETYSYNGLTDEGTDVGFMLDFALKTEAITEDQIDAMVECMDKKQTHAILVVEEIQEISVPTDIPGRRTTAHIPKVTSVDCVKAPGFLQVWREKMGIRFSGT
jgi:hypothetical protein